MSNWLVKARALVQYIFTLFRPTQPCLSCRHFVLFIKEPGRWPDGAFRPSIDLIDFISRTVEHFKINSLPMVLKDLAVLLSLAKKNNKYFA